MNSRSPSLHLVGLFLGLILFVNCTKTALTPQQEIRQFINQGIQAIESNQVSEVLPLISQNYKDDYGRNYDQMKSLTFFVMRRGQVTLFLDKLNIEVQAYEAQVKIDLIGLQGKHNKETLADFLPKSAKQWSLQLSLSLENEKWKLRAMKGDGFHFKSTYK